MLKLTDISKLIYNIEEYNEIEKIEINSNELAPFLKQGDIVSITPTHSLEKGKTHFLLAENTIKIVTVTSDDETLELLDLNGGKLCYTDTESDSLPIIGLGCLIEITKK